jgi:hypothetical protein
MWSAPGSPPPKLFPFVGNGEPGRGNNAPLVETEKADTVFGVALSFV